MPSANLFKSISGSSEQKIQAIFHLLFDPSDDSIKSLNSVLLSDPSSIVRHEAAYILGEKSNSLAVPALIKAMTSDTAAIVVHESALALANLGPIGYPESQKILIDLLKKPDANIVDTAEIALQRLEIKLKENSISFNKSVLNEILLDKTPQNKEQRIQASFLLMNDASTESVELLIDSLHSEPSPIVRHEIIFSLGESIHYKVVPELINVLETDPNFFCVHESLLALGTIGDHSAERSIRKFLTHDNPEIVESAEIGLERLFSKS